MRNPDEQNDSPAVVAQPVNHDFTPPPAPAVTPQPAHHDWEDAPEGPGVPVTPPGPPAKHLPPGAVPGVPIAGPNDPSIKQEGAARLQSELAFVRPKTAAADKRVLSLSLDPFDREYNAALLQAKADATRRQDLRGKYANLSGNQTIDPDIEKAIQAGSAPDPTEHDSTDRAASSRIANPHLSNRDSGDPTKTPMPDHDSADRALNRQIHYQNNIVVDAAGNPVGPAKNPLNPSSQTAAVSGVNSAARQALNVTGANAGQNVRTGDYVYVGSAGKDRPYGAGTTSNTDMFMSVDDAKASIGSWSPDELSGYQHAMGLAVTGLPDQTTYDHWAKVVETTARMTAAGRNVTVDAVAQMTAAAKHKKSSGGGSGGGGGGGGRGRGGGGGGSGGGAGAGSFPKAEVTQLLTQAMQKEVGRDPTGAEVDSFYAWFNANGSAAGAGQSAQDWVRTNLGKEQGPYQVATNYYQAMLAVLGGSAVGGAA